MASNNGPKSVSQATMKRLFAVSGNLCAFPKCSTALIDPQSKSVVGEICHIKGNKSKSPRYDTAQSNKDRHGFDNLILLCNGHHKVIDDDDVTYTVERLIEMKKGHENRHPTPPQVDAATVKHFIKTAISNSTVYGSVISSHGQTGGQIAHSITNNYGAQTSDEQVRLEAKVDQAADLNVVESFGCPGMQLTVICRSVRRAKIKGALLLIDDVDVMEGIRNGFGQAEAFNYTPLPGSTQLMYVRFLPTSKPNSQEGFVLDRDDVVRFFYPLPTPPTTLALRAKPENISIEVEFFDDTRQQVLTGDEIKPVLEQLYHVYQKRHGKFRGELAFGVTIKSLSRPGPEMAEAQGIVNQSYVEIAKPDPNDPEQSPQDNKGQRSSEPTIGFTALLRIPATHVHHVEGYLQSASSAFAAKRGDVEQMEISTRETSVASETFKTGFDLPISGTIGFKLGTMPSIANVKEDGKIAFGSSFTLHPMFFVSANDKSTTMQTVQCKLCRQVAGDISNYAQLTAQGAEAVKAAVNAIAAAHLHECHKDLERRTDK